MEARPNIQFPPFKVHNRTGSVQFTLQPAYFAGDTFAAQSGEVQVLRKGHLMVEMANAGGGVDSRGNTVYDWTHKVSMKFSEADIQQLLEGLRGELCKIVHDPNKARGGGADGTLPMSVLQLNKGERFGFFMTMSRGDKKAKCPISDAEAATLRLLMSRAVVRMYGW